MKEKKVYVIQHIAGSADGRPKINIMGASDYSTSRDFIFLLLAIWILMAIFAQK